MCADATHGPASSCGLVFTSCDAAADSRGETEEKQNVQEVGEIRWPSVGWVVRRGGLDFYALIRCAWAKKKKNNDADKSASAQPTPAGLPIPESEEINNDIGEMLAAF